jgi:hypothetical protein
MHKNALFSAVVLTGLIASGALAQDLQSVQVGSAQKEFPESITSTSDGALYAGSMTLGVIYKAAPGAASAERFVAAQIEGPPGISGVFADEANQTLWACYVDLDAFGGGDSKPSVLRSFDLATGAGKASYTFAAASFCNDIATTADGTVYATDAVGGGVSCAQRLAQPSWKNGSRAIAWQALTACLLRPTASSMPIASPPTS